MTKALAGIMKEPRAPAAARISAAIALLDRGWGKPSQAIEMDLHQKPVEELTDEELTAIIRNAERKAVSVIGTSDFGGDRGINQQCGLAIQTSATAVVASDTHNLGRIISEGEGASPCLHFRPRVAATPARLGSDPPAVALIGWDLHPHAAISFA
jgi:hypothetical protein